MLEQVEQAINFVGNLPSDRFIGAMIVSLVIAVATAGIYRWISRRKPVATTVLITFVFLANLACMLSTACFLQSTIPTVRMVSSSRGLRQQRISYVYDHFAPPGVVSGRIPSPRPMSEFRPPERDERPRSFESDKRGTSGQLTRHSPLT